MIQDFLRKVFGIQKQFEAGEKCVFVAVSPTIINLISFGTVLPFL
jgi:hypothetical protein